jgi:chromosomal replication initiation ATPase DnaA
VAQKYKIEMTELTAGSRRREITKARRDIALIAVKKLRTSGAEVARYLGVTTSSINYIVAKTELSSVGKMILDQWLK